MSPIKNFLKGWRSFFKGLRWLRQHPFYLMVLMIPMALGIALLTFGAGVFLNHQEEVLNWVLFVKPENWFGSALYYMAKGLFYVVLIVIGFVFYSLLVNVVSAPVYDYVSAAVEKDILKTVPTELKLRESLQLIGEELKKVLFIMLFSLIFLLTPGLNIISPLMTAFFVGWEFIDFSLARRGWRFRKRLKFVFANFFSVVGFGLWFLIPGIQFIIMPLAVVAGTMLAVERMESVNLNKVKR